MTLKKSEINQLAYKIINLAEDKDLSITDLDKLHQAKKKAKRILELTQ